MGDVEQGATVEAAKVGQVRVLGAVQATHSMGGGTERRAAGL